MVHGLDRYLDGLAAQEAEFAQFLEWLFDQDPIDYRDAQYEMSEGDGDMDYPALQEAWSDYEEYQESEYAEWLTP